MNKRERMLQLVNGAGELQGPLDYTPAAFFLHFDAEHHRGRPAIEKHLEFFRATDMDFQRRRLQQGFPTGRAQSQQQLTETDDLPHPGSFPCHRTCGHGVYGGPALRARPAQKIRKAADAR